jgi:hypothetical protein
MMVDMVVVREWCLTENSDHQTYRLQFWKRRDKQVYLDESQLKCLPKGVILLPENEKRNLHEYYNYECKSKSSRHLRVLFIKQSQLDTYTWHKI